MPHLRLLRVAPEHDALHDSGVAVAFLHADGFLGQPLHRHLFLLGAVGGHVPPDDLPGDLEESAFAVVSAPRDRGGGRWAGPEPAARARASTFFTTVRPCSSTYSSSVAVSAGTSGTSSPYVVERKGHVGERGICGAPQGGAAGSCRARPRVERGKAGAGVREAEGRRRRRRARPEGPPRPRCPARRPGSRGGWAPTSSGCTAGTWTITRRRTTLVVTVASSSELTSSSPSSSVSSWKQEAWCLSPVLRDTSATGLCSSSCWCLKVPPTVALVEMPLGVGSETTASCPTDDKPFQDAESRQSRQQRPALASWTRALGESPGGDTESTASQAWLRTAHPKVQPCLRLAPDPPAAR